MPGDAPAGAQCRICLQYGDDQLLGPLFAPCKCKGSSKYVHRRCLDYWRSTGMRPSNLTQCEICHYQYKFASQGTAWKVHFRLWAIIAIEIAVFVFLAAAIGFCLKTSDVVDQIEFGSFTFLRPRRKRAYFFYGCLFNFWCIGILATLVAIKKECCNYSADDDARRMLRRAVMQAAGNKDESFAAWVEQARIQRRECCCTCRADVCCCVGLAGCCNAASGGRLGTCRRFWYWPFDDWCLSCEAGLPCYCCGEACCTVCSRGATLDMPANGSGCDNGGLVGSILCIGCVFVLALLGAFMVFAATFANVVYSMQAHHTDVRIGLSRDFVILAYADEEDDVETPVTYGEKVVDDHEYDCVAAPQPAIMSESSTGGHIRMSGRSDRTHAQL